MTMTGIRTAGAALGAMALGLALTAGAQGTPEQRHADTGNAVAAAKDTSEGAPPSRCASVPRNTGYVLSYPKAGCKGRLMGNSVATVARYADDINNRATSVVNAGEKGRHDAVRFYQHYNFAGGSICLERGDDISDLRDKKLSNGKSANNRISSHKWVTSC